MLLEKVHGRGILYLTVLKDISIMYLRGVPISIYIINNIINNIIICKHYSVTYPYGVDFASYIQYNVDNGSRKGLVVLMWILFLVVLINGQADSKWVPFNTQKACETAKADATKHLAAIFPSGEASLTCFKANDVGKLT